MFAWSLSLWKQGLFNKPFQSSKSWHQLKDIVFLKWVIFSAIFSIRKAFCCNKQHSEPLFVHLFSWKLRISFCQDEGSSTVKHGQNYLFISNLFFRWTPSRGDTSSRQRINFWPNQPQIGHFWNRKLNYCTPEVLQDFLSKRLDFTISIIYEVAAFALII